MATGDFVRYFGTPLSRTWNRVLFLTWGLFAVAMGFLATASQRTGKRLWWVDAHGIQLFFTIALIYCSAVAVIGLAVKQSRFALPVAIVIGIAHIVSASFDLSETTGSAIPALVLAIATLAASLACMAGIGQRPSTRIQ
ncbi:MAG: hypothetical protein NWP73_08300 [Ilumatobacteraceae bacterium]|jgi:hypothetical protein|nr:hypothetical protein [Ilumatobacteraceae bacterium]MDP4702624.1 hypothetical protein [Ilumatobacteraceae bacterium]MDP5109750.1 hypothetical protein [Ilumatobacteraceae bacterium]